MDVELDYDLGAESLGLYLSHEMHVDGIIDGYNQELERAAAQMEDLERFLTLVKQRTDEESQRVDLQTEEERALIDRLRSQDELREIFHPPAKYTWKGKEELENLTRRCNQHIEGPLQRQISMFSEKMILKENQKNEILSLFKAGINRMGDLVRHINSNIQRIH